MKYDFSTIWQNWKVFCELRFHENSSTFYKISPSCVFSFSGSRQCSGQHPSAGLANIVPWAFETEDIHADIVLWYFEDVLKREISIFSSSPEYGEVDKGHNDYVEPPDEDVEEPDGVVGGQVDVGAGVQEVGVVLPHLNNYNNFRWISIKVLQPNR